MAIFSGSTKDCLEHFGSLINSNNQKAISELVQEYINVEIETFNKWLEGKGFPNGVNLIQLRYFLNAMGYRVSELLNLQTEVYDLGYYIAFKHIDYLEVSEKLDYTDRDSLLRVLRGKNKLSDEKKKLWYQILYNELRDKSSIVKREQMFANIRLKANLNTEKQVEHKHSDDEILLQIKSIHFATLVLLPKLSKLLLSEDNNLRLKIREQAGDGVVFKIANSSADLTALLNSLCSEEARKNNIELINKIENKIKRGKQ